MRTFGSWPKLWSSPERDLLVLDDARGITATSAATEAAKKNIKATKHKVKAIAAVGVRGVERILANLVVRDLYFAADLENAKDWLARQ